MDKNILLIEDHPDEQTLMLQAIRKSNTKYEVMVLSDGAEALDYLMGNGRFSQRDLKLMPSIILLDLNLPKISGFEVLRQIKINPKTKFIPVVILTSSNERNDVEKCYALGVNSYIRKPISFSDFSETINQLNHYWLELNEGPPISNNK